jgi:hypothetical protein
VVDARIDVVSVTSDRSYRLALAGEQERRDADDEDRRNRSVDQSETRHTENRSVIHEVDAPCHDFACSIIWSERLFRRSDVGVCPFTRVPVLIETGPYRVTRNPMYVGLICLNLGATLFSGVVANIWSCVAFAIWLHYAFVLPEEAFLRSEVGAAFDEYARRVPRWLLGG